MNERTKLRIVSIFTSLFQPCSVILRDLGSKDNPRRKKIIAVEGAIGINDREKA